MKHFPIHILLAIVAVASADAEDAIVFENGDVLTGTILKQDAEKVQFQTATLGTVSLNIADIAKIYDDSPAKEAPVALVEAPAAEPAPPPKAQNQPAPPAAPKPNDQTSSPPAPKPKAPSKWSGQTGLAIALRQKTYYNSAGRYRDEEYQTYRLYGNLDWKSDKNALQWKWTYRYSEDEIRTRDDYLNITQTYNRKFTKSYYAEAKTVYQRDYNRNIDNEYLQTAEIGINWVDLPSKLKISTSIGGGYHQYEKEDINTSEPKFIFDESFRWQLVNTLTLFQTYTHLGDLEKYHFILSAGLENKLIRDLFLRLEYRLDRDTETTYDNKGYYDRAVLTSLLYKF